MDSDEDFEINDRIRVKNVFAPSTNFIIITGIIAIFLILIFERLFIFIFLLIIHSYLLLIITWIIIHIFILRWMVLTGTFPGRNKCVQFYLRNIQAKIRANSLKDFLIDLNNKIDILMNTKNSEENIEEHPSSSKNSFVPINTPLKIYKKIIDNNKKLSSYEEKFYNELNELKKMIQNTSIVRYTKRIGETNKNLSVNIPNEERERYPLIKKQLNIIILILKEFLFENDFNIKEIFHYIHVFFYNNIFRSIEYLRIQSLYKKYNYEEINVMSNSYKLDCLLIKNSIFKKEENELLKMKNKNIVIVCGPNLTPFENLIRSWDIDELYLDNNTDVFFWNYRGFEYSEGSANLVNVKEDVENIYDYLFNLGVYKKIAVHGLSVGGIAACHLAKNRKIDLIIADRTFGSVEEIINSFPFSKYLKYLAQLLCIPMINNCQNFLFTECNKIVMNDPQDRTIIDKVSLKTQISKECIFKIFNDTNIDLNVRKIRSYNILDYALLPDDNKSFFECFQYTIDFLNSHKNQKKIKIDIDDKSNNKSNNNLKENLNDNEIGLSMKEIFDKFYNKLELFYSHFTSCYDSLIEFREFENDREHFDNFFNNFVIFGPEDKNIQRYTFCNINESKELLNEFIQSIENQIINNEDIRKYSESDLYIKFNIFYRCIKDFRVFLMGIHLENIEEKWLKQYKGTLIPLNCGHIAFYDDKEFETLKYIVKKEMIDNNESFLIYE